MDRRTTVLVSIAAGFVLTLLTGFVRLRTLAGGEHYGFPAAWPVRRVLAAEHFPWRIEPIGLAVDIALWTAVAYVVLRAYTDFDSGSEGAA